jgi:AbrB family looped-hinge helix DNA binding protein
MQTMRLRVRKKGQITLPQQLRERWSLDEGAEIVIAAEEDSAVIRPVRRTRVNDDAGSLGQADIDEVEIAIMDPELMLQHYSKKYPR